MDVINTTDTGNTPKTSSIPEKEYNSNVENPSLHTVNQRYAVKQSSVLKPVDLTNVGQTRIFARKYRDILLYSPATGYLHFNKKFWEESNIRARGLLQRLTDKQLKEAKAEIKMAEDKILRDGRWENTGYPPEYTVAVKYYQHVLAHRKSVNIDAVLSEAKPMLEFDHFLLERDEFLLNTPSYTWDLRKGLEGKQPHNPRDFITKITNCDPSEEGLELWLNALGAIFKKEQQPDPELINYVQEIFGLVIIGRVYVEKIIICLGTGANGKSTLLNAISEVLGTYSGRLSAYTLTTGCRRNIKPELAELRGKRLVISYELEQGEHFSASTLKTLASTDDIFAEAKYKQPAFFHPSHTLILASNHIATVNLDNGVLRRIIIIPFLQNFSGDNDIKNYGKYLAKNAGGAIMTWLINGAKRVIDNNFKINTPKVVEEAIPTYKVDNDWLTSFVEEYCEMRCNYGEECKVIYDCYKDYCNSQEEIYQKKAGFLCHS